MTTGKTWAVIVDRPAHEGWIADVDESQPGWRWQDYTGAHGNVYESHLTKEEAEKVLAEYLKCDSVEKGTYCYHHNPDADR